MQQYYGYLTDHREISPPVSESDILLLGHCMEAGPMAATDLVSSGPEMVDHMGIRLPLHPTISPGIAESIRTGRYERTEGKLLPAVIDRGERVVDLGGGLGFTAAVMARTGRAELVVCIE